MDHFRRDLNYFLQVLLFVPDFVLLVVAVLLALIQELGDVFVVNLRSFEEDVFDEGLVGGDRLFEFGLGLEDGEGLGEGVGVLDGFGD